YGPRTRHHRVPEPAACFWKTRSLPQVECHPFAVAMTTWVDEPRWCSFVGIDSLHVAAAAGATGAAVRPAASRTASSGRPSAWAVRRTSVRFPAVTSVTLHSVADDAAPIPPPARALARGS